MNGVFAMARSGDKLPTLTAADAGAPYIVAVGRKLNQYEDRYCGHEQLQVVTSISLKGKVWVCVDCWMVRDFGEVLE